MRFQIGRVLGGFLVALYLALALFGSSVQRPSDEEYQHQMVREYAALKEELARHDVRLSEIERREKELAAIQIEHRLTSMETTEQTNHTLLVGASLAIVLMLIETMIRGFAGMRRVARAIANGDRRDPLDREDKE